MVGSEWHSGMIGNMLKIGSGNFDMLVLDNMEGRMGSATGYAEPIA
jgi:hypothetical protein